MTLLPVAWAPLVDQLPAAEIQCNPDIQTIAAELDFVPSCYLVDLPVLTALFRIESAAADLAGVWLAPWWPSGPYSLDRPLVVAGHELGVTLYRLSDNLTGLVILEVPP